MSIDFDSKTTYGDDHKYIKTKIKTYEDSITTNFHNKKGLKKYQKKIYHINAISNNSRFCSLKISPPNIFRRM